jgi:hypothetical protein
MTEKAAVVPTTFVRLCGSAVMTGCPKEVRRIESISEVVQSSSPQCGLLFLYFGFIIFYVTFTAKLVANKCFHRLPSALYQGKGCETLQPLSPFEVGTRIRAFDPGEFHDGRAHLRLVRRAAVNPGRGCICPEPARLKIADRNILLGVSENP